MRRSITGLGVAALCAALASGSWAAAGPRQSFTTAVGRAATPRTTGVVCGDAYDPNESCAGTLATLGSGSYPGLQVAGFFSTGDADWYNVHLRTNEVLNATMTLAVPAGDAEIALEDAACSTLQADERSSGAVHSIAFTNTGPDADFHLVMGHYDGINCYTYTLDITINCGDAFDPNDVCAIATPIVPGVYPGLAAHWYVAGDFDWYKVHVRRSENLVLDLAYTNALGNLDGDIWADCSFTTLLASFFNTTDGDHVEVSNDGPDADWYIRIGNEDNTCNTYSMTLAVNPTGNIDGVTPLPGWSRPIISSNVPPGDPPVLSATLDGNAPDTYIRWCFTQTGAKSMPTHHHHFFIDDEFTAFGIAWEPFYPGMYFWIPPDPFQVRGGRHTLRAMADAFDGVPETNEFDNEYSEQFVWSPQLVTNASPLVRGVPPARGTGVIPNNDGFQFNRDPDRYDGVVAVAGRNPGDDYDIFIYGDYAGSTSGFSSLLGGSAWGSNATDFVLCSYNYAAFKLFPAALRFALWGGGGDYTIDQNEDQGRVNFLTTDYVWANQVMGADRLADVYDVYAILGETIYLTLRRPIGPSDMSFEIFPPDAGALFGREYGLATAVATTPSIDVLTFAVPATGFYPIVVYRTDGSSSDQSLTYDFAVGRAGPLAAPDPGSARELSFAGAAPNPLRGGGEFAFSLPVAGQASLALFDASGRQVSKVADREFPAGANRVAWDGRRADGAPLGPGVYWVRFAAAGKSLTRRVVVLK